MLCTNYTSFYSNLMHHFIVLYSNRLGPMCGIIVERSFVIRINIDRLFLLHLLFRFLPPPPPLPPPVLVWSYFSLVEKGTLVVPTYDRAKKRTQLNQTYLRRSIEHRYVIDWLVNYIIFVGLHFFLGSNGKDPYGRRLFLFSVSVTSRVWATWKIIPSYRKSWIIMVLS